MVPISASEAVGLRAGMSKLAKDLPWDKYASVWDKIIQYTCFLDTASSVSSPEPAVPPLPFNMKVFNHNIFQSIWSASPQRHPQMTLTQKMVAHALCKDIVVSNSVQVRMFSSMYNKVTCVANCVRSATVTADAVFSTSSLVDFLAPLINLDTLILHLPAVLVQAAVDMPSVRNNVRKLEIRGTFNVTAGIVFGQMALTELVWGCAGLIAAFDQPENLDRLETLTVENGASILVFGTDVSTYVEVAACDESLLTSL